MGVRLLTFGGILSIFGGRIIIYMNHFVGWMDGWMDGLAWIYLRTLLLLEHLAVLKSMPLHFYDIELHCTECFSAFSFQKYVVLIMGETIIIWRKLGKMS